MVAPQILLEPRAVVTSTRLMSDDVKTIWERLLTEPRRWLGADATFEPRTGGRIAADGSVGIVRRIEPMRTIEWEWSADGDPGWSIVELSLDHSSEGVTVTVIETLMNWEFESLPAVEATP
jgi:uncharacterized protein YndB with AHSA1/START domain